MRRAPACFETPVVHCWPQSGTAGGHFGGLRVVQQVATLEASEWYSRWPLWRPQSGTAGGHFGRLRVVQQVATLEA